MTLRKIQEISTHPSYSQEQKDQLIAKLVSGAPAPAEYVRETAVVPVEEKQDAQPTESVKEDWIPDYHKRFQATFTAFDGVDVFPIAEGKKQARIRKLKLGDYMMLAALVPKWKNYLLGDEPLNPFLIDESTGKTLDPVRELTLLLARAPEDWDFANNRPTGFALSFLSTLKGFLGNAGEIEINDFLDSDPEEIVNLVIGMYGNNLRFFTKITARFGIITDIKTVFLTLYSGMKNLLKTAAENLSDVSSGTDSQKAVENLKSLPAGSGNPSGGGKTHSSHRSAKARKGS